jgi:hypothetical protein
MSYLDLCPATGAIETLYRLYACMFHGCGRVYHLI